MSGQTGVARNISLLTHVDHAARRATDDLTM